MKDSDSKDGKRMIFLLAVALLYVVLSAVNAEAACTTPTSGLVLLADTTFCAGTYYPNASSTTTGAITIGASLNLSCNGTILIGNSTGYGLFSNVAGGFIEDCQLRNYSVGVYLWTSGNRITNNTIIDSGNVGIYVGETSNNNITRNFLYQPTVTGINKYGIHLYASVEASGNNVSNNMMSKFSSGMVLSFNEHHNIIYNNTINQSTGPGMFLSGGATVPEDNNITSNNISSSVGNHGIQMMADNNNFVGNIIDGHSNSQRCINIFASSNLNVFTNNTVGFCNYGIYIATADSTDNEFYWNNLTAFSSKGAYSVSSGNKFNTTVGGKPQGNAWGDVSGLEIYDVTGDIWGDYGNNYPYNASWGYVQGSDIQDWGPIVGANRPITTIVSPLSSTVLSGTVYAEVIAPDNTSMVSFSLVNMTGGQVYALNGSLGSTNDTFGSDGWKKQINWTAFNQGIYSMIASSYERGISSYVYLSSDTETDIFVDKTAPTISVLVYGSNGTQYTNTRYAMLNSTFADNYGIDECRCANDLSSLSIAGWEECVSAKPWLLTEGYANKTVYCEAKDQAGNTASNNASITYMFMPDFTPPTPPTVYDGASGDDIDWSNTRDALYYHWSNSTEDISTVYYLVKNCTNSMCGTAYTDVSTGTSFQMTGLSLVEGTNYSVEVLAYNSAGLNVTATSDGATLDLTKPGAPTINSTTHPNQGTMYASGLVRLNWSATDPLGGGVASGIAGYSYLLDKYVFTLPDDDMDPYTEKTIKSIPDDLNDTLVLKTAGADTTYSLHIQGNGNLSTGDKVLVGVKLLESSYEKTDNLVYDIFLFKKTAAAFGFNETSRAVSDVVHEARDIEHTADLSQAKTYYTELTVNETLGNEDWYVSILANTGDTDNTNNHSMITLNGSSQVDNTTQFHRCTSAGACTNHTLTIEPAAQIIKYNYLSEAEYLLSDGTYYFHVRAQDEAGNTGAVSHFRINVYGAGVDVRVLDPADNTTFVNNATTYDIDVEVGVGGLANATVVVEHADGSNDTADWVIFSKTETFAGMELKQGINEIYAIANTTYGAVTRSGSIYVTLTGGYVYITNKTLRVNYGGAIQDDHLTYTTAGGKFVGIASENTGAAAGELLTDTDDNTIKIFMTSSLDTAALNTLLSNNDFLDMENPSFAQIAAESGNLVRSELRPKKTYIAGDLRLPAGTYQIYLRKTGVTADGRANVTFELEAR